MPNTVIEWIWWVFASIIVATAINLVSPKIGLYLDKWSETRRVRRLAHNEAESRYVDEMVKLMLENSSLSILVAGHANGYSTRRYSNEIMAFITLSIGLFAIGTVSTRQADGFNYGELILVAVSIFSIPSYLRFWYLASSYRKRSQLYGIIAMRYQLAIGLPEPPKSP